MKKTLIMRILAGLLAVLMLTGTLLIATSCADSGENDPKETRPQQDESETDDGGIKAYDTVPKEKLNRDIIFMIPDSDIDIIPDEDEKGETLTDALFTRNIVVEDDFGVNLKVQHPANGQSPDDVLNNQIQAQFDDYDVYLGGRYTFANVATQTNNMVDLNTILSMDITQPWWDQSFRESLTVDGHNFMMTGDISPTSMLMTSCLVFNKSLMADLKKKEPYDLVRDGQWTLGTLLNYVEGVSNESLGRYGLSGWIYDLPFSFYYGSGDEFIKLDKTGFPVIDFDKAKFIEVYETIYDIIVAQNSLFTRNYDTEYMTTYEEFVEGNVLFCDLMLSKISQFITGMSDEYGVLPIPKYDGNQKTYRSFTNSTPSIMMANTKKNSDREIVGTVLEAMATYNYDYVTDHIIDVIYKSKDVRDPESAEMIDYIIRDRVFDFAYWTDLDISNIVRDALNTNNPDRAISANLNGVVDTSKSQLKQRTKNWDKIFN